MVETTKELEPCPFCGAAGEIAQTFDEHGVGGYHGRCTANNRHRAGIGCACQTGHKCDHCRVRGVECVAAITAWNTRATPSGNRAEEWRPDREAIARIVDPHAWSEQAKMFQSIASWEAKGTPGAMDMAQRYRDGTLSVVAPSLTKADQIRALALTDNDGSRDISSLPPRALPEADGHASGVGAQVRPRDELLTMLDDLVALRMREGPSLVTARELVLLSAASEAAERIRVDAGLSAQLRALANAADDMLTGVAVHNRLNEAAPARAHDIAGPVVTRLGRAIYSARRALQVGQAPTSNDTEKGGSEPKASTTPPDNDGSEPKSSLGVETLTDREAQLFDLAWNLAIAVAGGGPLPHLTPQQRADEARPVLLALLDARNATAPRP
jgi:hypothetical protein